MYSKTWKSKQKFFRGDEERLITANEKLAIAFLAGATVFITLQRLYWLATGQLKIWF